MEMNTKLKYLPIAAFAAIALTLAGCGGGGGGGGPVASVVEPTDEMVEAAEAAVMAAETAKTALSDAWAAYEMAPSEAGATAITDAATALVAAAAVLGEAAVDDDQTAAVEGFNAYAALVGTTVLGNAQRAVASVEASAAKRVTELNSQISGLNEQITTLGMRPTQVDVDALNEQITTLSMRDDITPADVQALRDQITTLGMRADITPEQVTALNDQITALMMRTDITPEQVTALNDQITALMMRPTQESVDEEVARLQGQIDDLMMRPTQESVDALNEQITTLSMRDDITPADVQALRGQITTLGMRADITPEQVTALNDQITALMMRTDITPEQVTALNDQITALMMRPTQADLDAQVATLQGQIETLGMRPTQADVDALNEQITTLSMRDDITPADVQALRDQITTLGMRADITPEQVTALNEQITALMMGTDITPGQVAALNEQITALMMRPTQESVDEEVERLQGQITTLTMERDTALRDLANARDNTREILIGAFATAQNSRDDATGAATTATAAVEAATEASVKITTLPAVGDSAAAEANAKAVLDAQIAVNAAVMTAQTALDDAKEALDAVDKDADNADSLTRALGAAIVVAEEQLEIAKEQAEGDALKMAVELVTGVDPNDPDDEDYPMTPAQLGRTVAMDIDAALSPTSVDNGAPDRGTHGASAPGDAFEDAVRMNDHQGSTWEEIVGAANVSDKRIAVDGEGEGTKVVKAASVAGMTLTSMQTAAPMVPDGTQVTTDIEYKGIRGTVFCAGSDCAVENVPNDAEDADVGAVVEGVKKLTGSWYFTPEHGDEWYVGTTAAGVTTYEAETLYAQFGHWLESDEDNLVNTYALGGVDATANSANTASLNVRTVNTGDTDTTLLDSSASYRGPAAGMSVHQTVNTDGTINTIQSAAFTATVNLEATFGENPTLGGTVTDFQGDATDSSWSVKLLATGFDVDASTVTAGRTVASGQDGEWTATSYGPMDGRPTGIFGGFNAHFTDGHAAGAYATRK